jgi:hypothetical protein
VVLFEKPAWLGPVQESQMTTGQPGKPEGHIELRQRFPRGRTHLASHTFPLYPLSQQQVLLKKKKKKKKKVKKKKT